MTQQLMIEDHGGGLEIEKHSFEEEKKLMYSRYDVDNNKVNFLPFLLCISSV